VTEFCKLWTSPDPEQLAGYFTEEAIYHNIPMDPVQGREARYRSPYRVCSRSSTARSRRGVTTSTWPRSRVPSARSVLNNAARRSAC
jgi:hypothetical protein